MIERGIVVVTPGGGPSVQSTAELALALMLAAARRIPKADQRYGPAGSTDGSCPSSPERRSDYRLGRIGAQMARYCNALGTGLAEPELTDERALAAGATRFMTGAGSIRRRKPSPRHFRAHARRARRRRACAHEARRHPVNTSRGPQDEAALIDAVQSGRLRRSTSITASRCRPTTL
jgi:phosphoglycerate dehydrogenase-like enzyme